MKKPVSQELERKLNPEQIAAVTHGEGPQLVLAGAGSGKTRVITHRIYWLIEEMGVDPGTIAAMTFTNKAAGEMRERVEDLLNMHPLPTSVGTFHRYGLMMMRRYGERVGLRRDFHILDGSDQIGLIKEALTAEGLSETAFSPRSVLANISAAKNKLIDPAAYESKAQNFFEKKVSTLYRRYQGLLHAASGVDFDDLIALPVKLLSTDEDWQAVVDKLVELAKAGESWAVRELLDRVLGRPTEADLIDRIESLEALLEEQVRS